MKNGILIIESNEKMWMLMILIDFTNGNESLTNKNTQLTSIHHVKMGLRLTLARGITTSEIWISYGFTENDPNCDQPKLRAHHARNRHTSHTS